MEKPDRDADLINGGFCVFKKGIAAYLTGDDCILERDPMEALARDGQLRAFVHTGFWQCMDTYRETEMLNKLWTDGHAPWKVW